jgi:phosphatidate phosphatase APP1
MLELPDGSIHHTTTDAEGYYLFQLQLEDLRDHTDEEGWLPFSLSFTDKNLEKHRIDTDNNFSGQVMIPPSHAEYGVITDIDDTILQTGVTSLLKWRLVVNSLFRNIDRRRPVDGAAELLNNFHLDEKERPVNPIFYVSNSPWNLYIYLKGFLELNDFPKGPILLRDIRTPFDKTPKPEVEHKVAQIRNILDTYPHLEFFLVGDNGQKDPIIYNNIAMEYPGRIKDIYLREVK